MKKIGFVDYYISEWHAENYPAWIEETNEKLGTDYKVCYAWAEQYDSPYDGRNTDKWCEDMGIEKCETVEELCEKSDVIVVLAPSDPDTHLRLAEKVLPFGKRTYIDKTFAPDLNTAKKIFALGKENSAPFFSTSALRYATELNELENTDNLIITGGGSNFNEYIIHIVEMAVVLLNDDLKKAKVEIQGPEQRLCRLETVGGKKATFVFAPGLGHSVLGVKPDGCVVKKDIQSDFFKGLMAEIIKFFESGELPFDANQTLQVMTMRDALLSGEEKDGEWLEI